MSKGPAPTPSPAKDPASPPDSDEEPAYPYKPPDPLIEILRSNDNGNVILSYIFMTPKISYELFIDMNVIDHLQHRIAEDSFL